MKIKNQKNTRRWAIKSIFASAMTAGAGLFGIAHAKSNGRDEKARADQSIRKFPSRERLMQGQQPLFSGSTVHNGFVFVAGKGEHGEGDIKVHTEKVLDMIEEELIRAGSSMEKALQVNVYLHNIRHYDGMNEVYRGRFGDNPPARSTVACYNGIPGNSLVEMDCIAAL
jgi:2-iminobutanoate/2-iminopropanoate deaminase